MVRYQKHQDSLDVQVRTKFLDQEGHEMKGVIEYDPVTGYGKRIKDSEKGLVEDFFRADGHMELDGHTFTSDNHNEEKVEAIKTVIKMGVNRNKDPKTYEDLISHHTNLNRSNTKHGPITTSGTGATESMSSLFRVSGSDTVTTFTATQNIKKGNKVQVNLETGEVELHPDELIFKADEDRHNETREQEKKTKEQLEQRRNRPA